ncbi:competence protein CoiA family protein [Hydrogenovibrio marinus]|uniref:Competence protein CoiA-like N-terminal domain-containing protein n=1 Tax=Hydrogenovibrio marinus TaxID=28885 RepID=A0A066ZM74_HYDMR|nr:competence protein CoiA family protein [Hydrogenovibrio marinus]KDN94602.1 hypothetical protein EI16_11905 [Hydrogenovibrio marinus]
MQPEPSTINSPLIKTPFALPAPNENPNLSCLVSVEEAQSGTDYFCPDCFSRMRVRKGLQKAHHFYHVSKECPTGGLETVAHLLAKSIIEKEKVIWIPNGILLYKTLKAVEFKDNEKEELTYLLNLELAKKKELGLYTTAIFSEDLFFKKYNNKNENTIIDTHAYEIPMSGFHNIETVRVEPWLDGIRPDLIVTIDGRDYLIEIAVTHLVDSKKLEKIKQKDLPVIEINVGRLARMNYATIRDLLTKRNNYSRWLHYPNSIDAKFSYQESFL